MMMSMILKNALLTFEWRPQILHTSVKISSKICLKYAYGAHSKLHMHLMEKKQQQKTHN